MNGQSVKIIFIEPFFSGSHRAFAERWKAHSRHEVEILGFPGRFWKWRMRSAALEAARIVLEKNLSPELWVCGTLMDVAHFKALLGSKCAPVAVYFHEAQVSYPAKGGMTHERDYHYLMTDLVSAGVADEVWFNTDALRRAFLTGTRAFLERMPDTRPLWLLDEIERKSRVLHLGIELDDLKKDRAARRRPYAILWPHRWEHDKNPEGFFAALETLKNRGLEFRLLVAGGRYSKAPEVFDCASHLFADRIDHWGEVRQRSEYVELLARADIVVSTARHETFGISMVEAAYAGAHPVAPARLSYPEVIPEELHGACLYRDEEELVEMLAGLLGGERELVSPARLGTIFQRYDWKNRSGEIDSAAFKASQIRR